MAAADTSELPAFEAPGTSERPGWPGSTLEYSLPLRATAGLTQAYAAVDRSRHSAGSTSAAARKHATYPDGSLCLTSDMPLLARRYRFLHTLSETPLSQLLCAADTYCSCSPRADGRRQPLVAIKVLNAQHWVLGAQEYERMRRLLLAQDQGGAPAPVASASCFFECGAHFCIVMPLLCELSRDVGSADALLPCTHPASSPRVSSVQAHYGACGNGLLEPRAADRLCKLNMETLRRLAARLLGALVFLHQHDVIHADVKPENVMADPPGDDEPAACAGVEGTGWRARLIDFSNAMTTPEATAYYDTFEVQTLGYRAPEVIFGAPFGHAIDIWSLGVTLAEFLSGRYLLQAASRGGLAVQVAQLLGRPPAHLFRSAKFAPQLLPLVAHQPPTLSPTALRARLTERLGASRGQHVQQLLDLITGMLRYDSDQRITAAEALCHPFLSPLFPWRSLVPRPTLDAADDKARLSAGAAVPAAHPATADLGSLRPRALGQSPVKKLRGAHPGVCHEGVDEEE